MLKSQQWKKINLWRVLLSILLQIINIFSWNKYRIIFDLWIFSSRKKHPRLPTSELHLLSSLPFMRIGYLRPVSILKLLGFFFFGGGGMNFDLLELLCRLWTCRILKSFIIMLWNHRSCQYSNHGQCYNMFEFWWYTRDFWGVLYTIWILFTRETFMGKIIWTCVYCKISRRDASNLFYLMVLKASGPLAISF